MIASCEIDVGGFNTGAVVSTILMIWVAVALLPDVSVAVHVTMVSPSGNASGASLVIEATSTISVDTANPISNFIPELSDISISISDGDWIDGTVVSSTITYWMSVALLPDVSVAVHVTMVSPSGNASGASLVIEATSTWSDASAKP